jgi:hypothetical protein
MQVERFRALLRSILWISAHMPQIALAAVGTSAVVWWAQRGRRVTAPGAAGSGRAPQ